MLDKVHRQGAAAARRGLTLLDSPFLRAEAMPAHTGERIKEWQDKVNAWESGWHAATRERGHHQRNAVGAALIRALRAKGQRNDAHPNGDIFCFTAPSQHDKLR